jgi:hypothetical protein
VASLEKAKGTTLQGESGDNVKSSVKAPTGQGQDQELLKRYACTGEGKPMPGCARLNMIGDVPSFIPATHSHTPILPNKREEEANAAHLVKRAPLVKPVDITEGVAIKREEHSEFMRRWLQGDEHPRAFMIRSEDASSGEGQLQRRAIETGKEQDDVQAQERDYYDDHTDCTGASAKYDKRCIGRVNQNQRADNVSGRGPWKRSAGEVDENQMHRRAVENAEGQGDVPAEARDYYSDGYTDCTDASDRYNGGCVMVHGRLQRKTDNGTGPWKRSTGEVNEHQMQRRAIETAEGQGDVPAEARDYYSDDDDDSFTNCTDRSDRNDPRCLARRKIANGTGPWKRSTAEVAANDVGDDMEKRSWHSGSGSHHGRRRRYYHRRDVDEVESGLVRRDVEEDLDALEKRSHSSHGGGRRYRGRYHRRNEDDGEAELVRRETSDNLEKRSYHSAGSRDSYHSRYRNNWRRDVNVDDDALTERSALSEFGDIHHADLIAKRDVGSMEQGVKGEALSKRQNVPDGTSDTLKKRDCECLDGFELLFYDESRLVLLLLLPFQWSHLYGIKWLPLYFVDEQKPPVLCSSERSTERMIAFFFDVCLSLDSSKMLPVRLILLSIRLPLTFASSFSYPLRPSASVALVALLW